MLERDGYVIRPFAAQFTRIVTTSCSSKVLSEGRSTEAFKIRTPHWGDTRNWLT